MKKVNGSCLLAGLVLALVGCGDAGSAEDSSAGTSANGGTGNADDGTLGGSSNGGSGSATASGGSSASGGTSGDGGSGNSGGSGVGGSSSGTGGTGNPPMLGDPVLPSPDGDCPDFDVESQVIKGLQTEVRAGTPGAVKGPLVFAWHGTGLDGASAVFQLGSSVLSDILAQGGVVIAPTNNGQVRVGPSPNDVWYEGSDLEYADHIVACAVQNHNIDPRRIYATGCSAGGLMSAAMAVKRSNYVAAVAPNSGGLTFTIGLQFQDPTRIPAGFTMHGEGGFETSFVGWSANFDGFLTDAGGFAVNCDHGGGHCGAPLELREAAWEFLKAHPFGIDPYPYSAGLPGTYPNYCTVIE